MEVKLLRQDLWQKFSQLGNEMIITKRGRNMFPTLQYRIGGLEPDALYRTSLLLLLCDEKKYRYLNGQWDKFDPCVESTHHPREVFVGNTRTGHDLMKRGISFDKIKITNADDVCCPNREVIRVQSMRKYIPILSIYKVARDSIVPPVRVAQVRFEETQFVAVTAYQNSAVKDLKVQNNKYALGFRENVQKRPSTSPHSYTSSDDSSTSPPSEKRAKLSPEFATANMHQFYAPLPDYSPSFPPHAPSLPPPPPFFDPALFTPYFASPHAYYDCFNPYNPWSCPPPPHAHAHPTDSSSAHYALQQ